MTAATAAAAEERPAQVLTSEEALMRAGVDAKSGLSADEAAWLREEFDNETSQANYPGMHNDPSAK